MAKKVTAKSRRFIAFIIQYIHMYSCALVGFTIMVKYRWMIMKYLKLQKYSWKGRSKTELTGRSPLRGGGSYWIVVSCRKRRRRSRRRSRRRRKRRRRFVSGI